MQDSLQNSIKALAIEQLPTIKQIRRQLHMNPELAFQEFETSKYISQLLTEIGIEHKNIAGTGIVGIIKGKNPTKVTVALRADIDALPIEEANQVEYKSQNPGIMHACGHDVHTASLIGAAKILNSIKDKFAGTLKLLFQPAEEKNPGGAIAMINEGALKNPIPCSIIGQHVYPTIPVGSIGFCKGMAMSSADEIYISVKGKGGHAGLPHLAVDPIIISAHIITALQQVVSRYSNPIMPSVLSLCTINAGSATNIIPEEVNISGTFRSLDENWRFIAHKKMKDISYGIAKSMGGDCIFDINKGYPALYNDPKLTQKIIEDAKQYLGENNIVEFSPIMCAEDFAYYSKVLPGCFYFLGVQNKSNNINSALHSATFDVDEKSLEIGAGLMSWIAIRELSR